MVVYCWDNLHAVWMGLDYHMLMEIHQQVCMCERVCVKSFFNPKPVERALSLGTP